MLKLNKEKTEVKAEYDRILKESGLDKLVPVDTEDGSAGYCTEAGILKSTTDDNYFYRADWESGKSWIYLCVYADGSVHGAYKVVRGKGAAFEDSFEGVTVYNCPTFIERMKEGVNLYEGRD